MENTTNNKWQRANKGFTLLEMTLALGIFTTLVLAAVGITIGVSNSHIKSQNVQVALDNVRFGLELISRELRTGVGFNTDTSPCGGGGTGIKFRTGSDQPRIYYFNSAASKIVRVKKNVGETILSADCTNVLYSQDFMGGDVEVLRFNALVSGAISGPTDGQPRATIILGIKSKSTKAELRSPMHIQTTVVQRFRETPAPPPPPQGISVPFVWTGANQTWVVPTGVTWVTVKAWGAGGGGGIGGTGTQGNGGGSGFAQNSFLVTPTESLIVVVGGRGGFGVGGAGGAGGGGGGSSAILRSATILVNAGGGGGGASNSTGGPGGNGGAGGDANGVTGACGGSCLSNDGRGGAGGTQSSGGAGGTGGSGPNGNNGSINQGGTGGNGDSPSGSPGAGGFGGGGLGGAGGGSNNWSTAGGGGGGGYYGGGGGEGTPGGAAAGGGGGGSSFGSTLSAGSGTTPGNSSDSDRSGAGQGGLGGATPTDGTHGRIVISY